MSFLISPSVMCISPFDYARILPELAEGGADLLHMDLMDGRFVPNLALGIDACKAVSAFSPLPLDYHLMVEEPERVIPWLPIKLGDWVSIHAESTRHAARVLSMIREAGAHPALAINPATPVEYIREVLPLLDGVLIMTVNPGFAGQKMVPGSLEKITRVRALLKECGHPDLPIQVDGNVSLVNAPKMAAAGADCFVAGTSSVLVPGADIAEACRAFRSLIENAVHKDA